MYFQLAILLFGTVGRCNFGKIQIRNPMFRFIGPNWKTLIANSEKPNFPYYTEVRGFW